MSATLMNRATMFSPSPVGTIKNLSVVISDFLLGNTPDDKGYKALLGKHVMKSVGEGVVSSVVNAVNMLVMTKVPPVMPIDKTNLIDLREKLIPAIEAVNKSALGYVPQDPILGKQFAALKEMLRQSLAQLDFFTKDWASKGLEKTFEAPAMSKP
jgi:hypothetical protein